MSTRGILAVLLGLLPVTLGVLAPASASTGIAASVVVALLLSAAGGYLTARVAPDPPGHHVAALAAVGAFLSIVTTLSASGVAAPQSGLGLLAMLVGISLGGATRRLRA